jgi:hypothetical protein
MTRRREANEERILLLTATGRDGELACDLFARVELVGYICRDLRHVLNELPAGAGAILIAQEAIELSDIAPLRMAMENQPAWSDVPMVLVAAPGDAYQLSHGIVKRLRPVCNVTLLERPLQKLTLVTAMQVALRSRRRQYEVRNLLSKLEASRLELYDKILDLQKFEEAVVGRELRMMDLEKEVIELKHALELTRGENGRYLPGDQPSHLVT